MEQTLYMTVQAAVAAVCWLIVAGGAGLAVFARCIHDTTMERAGLSAVSVTSVGAAYRIVANGWTSDVEAALAIAMAGYVAAVAYKHMRGAQ